jgi:hypothetical protein
MLYEKSKFNTFGRHILSTDHDLIPAGCKRPQYNAGGAQSMEVDGRLPIGQR